MDEENRLMKYGLCLRNEGYAASLEVRKIYQILSSAPNEAGFVRVVDESGEDYLYPADFFVILDLPNAVEEALRKAA